MAANPDLLISRNDTLDNDNTGRRVLLVDSGRKLGKRRHGDDFATRTSSSATIQVSQLSVARCQQVGRYPPFCVAYPMFAASVMLALLPSGAGLATARARREVKVRNFMLMSC